MRRRSIFETEEVFLNLSYRKRSPLTKEEGLVNNNLYEVTARR